MGFFFLFFYYNILIMIRLKILFFLFICIILFYGCKDVEDSKIISFKIENKELAPLDSRIFGQFLEKPSWGNEIGTEAALDTVSHQLQDGVFELIKAMNIPVMRFPGGTDIDILDWTDMIDNAPGRSEDQRPLSKGHTGTMVTNYFGYDEALKVCENIGSEVILVVNFGDAYFKRKSIREAALHAAGLVAYCNAKVGSNLPAGMSDWPSVRSKNGREEPYYVKYFQIANEPFVLDRQLKVRGDINDSLVNHYYECLEAYIDLMKEVDPEIKIIVDGNSEDLVREIPSRLGKKADFVAYHVYYPWNVKHFVKDGKTVAPDTLSEAERWYAWVSTPQYNENGLAVLNNPVFENVKNINYPIAVTEWNWNGWWSDSLRTLGLKEMKLAQGIGAAGFLHAMMRNANQVKMGCQSMLVGNSWGITGIRVDRKMNENPHYFPTGLVTGLYSNHHGNSLVEVSSYNMPMYEQPYKMNGIDAYDSIAYLDVLASKSNDSLFIHVINRSFDTDYQISLDLSAFSIEQNYFHHVLTGDPNNAPYEGYEKQVAAIVRLMGSFEKEKLQLKIPKHSVSVIAVGLKE
jgi:alpha-L-arabinofuranosidase